MNNELENSINYIKEKTGNNSGFSIPKDYLNGIEDDFMLKLKEEELPKTTPFDIPDTYFDNLETAILNKVTNTPKKGKVISLKNKLYKFIPASIAASLLLLITTQFFNNQSNTISLDDLSYTDVENWFEENTIYTDTEMVFNFEDNVDDIDFTLTSVNINDNAIEDYLNSIDESYLINEAQ